MVRVHLPLNYSPTVSGVRTITAKNRQKNSLTLFILKKFFEE